METHQILIPPLSGWAPSGSRVPGRPVAAPAGSPADGEAVGGQPEEPLERLRRCLDRMDALVCLLEADLRRQRDLLASLTAPPRRCGPQAGRGEWSGPPGGRGEFR